jgi:hypothetical protein
MLWCSGRREVPRGSARDNLNKGVGREVHLQAHKVYKMPADGSKVCVVQIEKIMQERETASSH